MLTKTIKIDKQKIILYSFDGKFWDSKVENLERICHRVETIIRTGVENHRKRREDDVGI